MKHVPFFEGDIYKRHERKLSIITVVIQVDDIMVRLFADMFNTRA